MKEIKKHYPEIDKLRGIAIIMVLLYHAIIVYPINLHEIGWCRILHEFLWYMEMPLFFIVSGFCFSYTQGQYKGYLLKKMKRLLIPHFAFGLLEILPRIIPNPLVREQMPAKEALRDLLFYGGGDWFLWTLFLIFLIFPLLHVIGKRGIAGKLLIFAGTIVLYGYSYRMTNLFLIQMWAWFMLYFTVGYLIRQADYGKIKQVLVENRWMGGIGVFIMLAIFWWNMTKGENRLLTVCGVLGGLLFFWMLAEGSRGLAEKILLACGTYSLQMYLLGSFALVGTRTLLVSILGIKLPIVIILGNFILDTILTLWVSKYILARFKPLRILSGLAEGGKQGAV